MLVIRVSGLSARGVPLCLCQLLPSFSAFFDCSRAVRCMLPVASCRLVHLVVLYGYQGADADTGFDWLGVVFQDQPCLIVGDFNVELIKFFAW